MARVEEERAVWSYSNPVRVLFGPGTLSELPSRLAGRPYALVTYSDAPFGVLRARIEALVGPPRLAIDTVKPNPDFESVAEACRQWATAGARVQVIVALGGGSVIDTAKALSAADGDFSRVRLYLEGAQDLDRLGSTPIIAVPTTAGTGSEVTMWATLWDVKHRRKHSLSRPSLYAESAIIDPTLTLELPTELTISTGLDALSHALESLWNRNANPVSTELAVAAATEILQVLPEVVLDGQSIALRTRMARAALFAGLAFSNTKTALAHSLSYPITLEYGVSHGVACSFTLPAVMRSVIGENAACDAALRRILGDDLDGGADRLDRLLADLGVSVDPTSYGIPPKHWRDIVTHALEGERGVNFIGRPSRVFTATGVASPFRPSA